MFYTIIRKDLITVNGLTIIIRLIIKAKTIIKVI